MGADRSSWLSEDSLLARLYDSINAFESQRAERRIPYAIAAGEELPAWENEFADDPRYWQLRFWAERWQQSISHTEGERRDDSAQLVALFDETFRRTPPNPDLLCNIYSYCYALDPQQRGRMCDAIVAAAPDQAWPRYYRGHVRLMEHDYTGALVDMQAGNNACDRHFPYLYPRHEVVRLILTEELLSEEQILFCNTLLHETHSAMLCPGSSVIEAGRLLTREWYLKHPELFSEYIQYLCHLVLDDYPDNLRMICADIPASRLLRRLIDPPGIEFSGTQAAAIRKFENREYPSIAWAKEQAARQEDFHQRLQGNLPAMQVYKIALEHYREELQDLEEKIRPAFRALLELDLSQPVTGES